MDLDSFVRQFQVLKLDERPHHQGSLLLHLTNVARLLQDWGCEEHIIRAGFCHSLFGTSYYKNAPLELSEIEPWKHVIDEKTLRLVHLFRSMNRKMFMEAAAALVTSEPTAPAIWSSETLSLETVTRQEVIDLLHILLANTIDHERGVLDPRQWYRGMGFSKTLPLLLPAAAKQIRQTYPVLQAEKPRALVLLGTSGPSLAVDVLLTAGYSLGVVRSGQSQDRWPSMVEVLSSETLEKSADRNWEVVLDFRHLDPKIPKPSDLSLLGRSARSILFSRISGGETESYKNLLAQAGAKIKVIQLGTLVDSWDQSRFLHQSILRAYRLEPAEREKQILEPVTLLSDFVQALFHELTRSPEAGSVRVVSREGISFATIYDWCEKVNSKEDSKDSLASYFRMTFKRVC